MLAGLATVMVAVLIGMWFVRPDVGTHDPEARPPEGSAACIPVGPLTSVDAINEFLSTAPGVQSFQGADVGVDVGLQDGRRLWLFGDTLRDGDGEREALVRNSMLVFSADCIEVVDAGGGAVIPDRQDGVGYWPMSVFRQPGSGLDTVFVMAQRVRTVAPGLFGFEVLGSSIAVFLVPWGETPQLIGVRDLDADLVDPQRPVWGAAAAVDDGWVYLFGTSRRPMSGLHGFALSVARVRPAHVLDTGRWRYWEGAEWVMNPGRAWALIDERGGVSQTLSVFEQEGEWFALSKRDDFLGNDLVVWTAPSPVGPFDDGTTVAPLPGGPNGELTYMALAHPELLPQPGTVVVSWSRNSGELDQIFADPLLYRPRFGRVPLPE